MAYFIMAPFSSSWWRVFFSSIHHENLEVKLKKRQTPDDWVYLELSSFCLVYFEPPAVHQLQFRFFRPRHRFILCWLFLCNLWFSVSICLSLHLGDQLFVTWPLSSERCQKIYWFFSIFNILLVVRMELWFLSSLHAEWEMKSPSNSHFKRTSALVPCKDTERKHL